MVALKLIPSSVDIIDNLLTKLISNCELSLASLAFLDLFLKLFLESIRSIFDATSFLSAEI